MTKCSLCNHGEAHGGRATLMLERADSVIVLKNVPAEICDNCGEQYFTPEVLDEAMQQANAAIARGAVLEVIKFAA
jgi:YgiT-type zinc finger domain-containing protein